MDSGQSAVVNIVQLPNKTSEEKKAGISTDLSFALQARKPNMNP